MKKLQIILGIAFVTLLMACGSSGPSVKNDFKKLRSYNSYAFLPNKDTIITRDYDNDKIQQIIVETVQNNMQEQGYNLDTAIPDVLVYVHPMFDEKVSVNANPVYTNFSYYRPGFYLGPYYEDNMYENYFTVQRVSGPRVQQVNYMERSIVIDVIDRRTNEILWRGTGEEQIKTRRLEREIREYIDEVFRNFP